jgi:hypothetical protein
MKGKIGWWVWRGSNWLRIGTDGRLMCGDEPSCSGAMEFVSQLVLMFASTTPLEDPHCTPFWPDIKSEMLD